MVARTIQLPNVKKFFIPDPGMIIGEADLDRADLQVVTWEAKDEPLKAALRLGLDIHQYNADTIGCSRQHAKVGVHATNYGASARTVAIALGISIAAAQAFQEAWFEAHPGIKDWHTRVETMLSLYQSVSNKFGYSIQYFDRVETVFPQALAWIPQSTVANVINLGMLNLANDIPEVELLMQVHDSLLFQFPAEMDPEIRPRIRDALSITIPYDDPLIIPAGLTLSHKSWGDVEKVEWEEAA